MGHPTLRQPARPLEPDEIGSEVVHRLVADMIETLHDYGGIGLAAPQVNESIRLAIVELPGGSSRYGELPELPLTVFVNPRIEVLDSDTAGYWEGCLSVPGLRGYVERPQHVQVTASNLQGEDLSLELRGFAATVFQHEFDHLEGRLYLDHITDARNLVFEQEYERYVLPFEDNSPATPEKATPEDDVS
jgi:peptide deformylase